jgi:hypothetical protein
MQLVRASTTRSHLPRHVHNNHNESGAPVLMASRSALLPTTPRALDSPSGEPFFRLHPMDAHLPSPSRRTPGGLPDTPVPCRSQVRALSLTTAELVASTCTIVIRRRINLKTHTGGSRAMYYILQET